MLNWEMLLNDARRKDKNKRPATEKRTTQKKEVRTEIERDYDRILFSTPLRRLADKTQVFPLERNASVRTRLTHSHEVSNLARSIGVNLVFNEKLIDKKLRPERNVPAMLATIGLAHDLGNPPFGHQGESAIQSWFEDNRKKVFNDEYGKALNDAQKQDFLRFEGNAQTIRLLTRLQLINDDFGLNLTYGTLAALMKYPVPSNKVKKKKHKNDKVPAAKKKHNFFQSERKIVEEIWRETGLSEGVRHPLTYLMEACDDIAYAVLDAEDAVKKSLVSYSDLVSFLNHEKEGDQAITRVLDYAWKKHNEFRNEDLSPGELNDISMQMFRVAAIGEMINDVSEAFVQNKDKIMQGKLDQDLIDVSEAGNLCRLLKEFDKNHAYKHRSVLEVELTGYNTIRKLMDYFWVAITERKDANDVCSARRTPFASYAYSRISENYRRVFENSNSSMPVRYRELQLMTDMISGMTDSFALALLEDLKKYDATINH
jgi:dGTPase